MMEVQVPVTAHITPMKRIEEIASDSLATLPVYYLSRYAMKKRKYDVKEDLLSAIEHRSIEGMGDDPVLESKHKIFLSHSGAQKEFVEHLCKALEDCCHYPFFDRHPDSLPMGKQFPDLIVKAVQQCVLLVVVVSEEYFMSKWPMIELNAFVQANKEKKSKMNPGILPLFYGLSVNDLKDEKRRERWVEKWETFAMGDPQGRISINDWKYALDELRKFNGLSYDRELKEILAYENKIVSYISKSILPDIKWDESHVQGKSSIHKVIGEKIEQIGPSQKYKVKVVGIYGVGGIGKTTTCKTLCNELSSEYGGRVCHIEFESTNSNCNELLQKVLVDLTRKSHEVIQALGEGECKDILHRSLPKQRTFLAIDNVWDNGTSIKQAKMFLEAPSNKDSLVIVTARSRSTLQFLGIDKDACIEMPELGQADAMNLFLHYVGDGEQFTKEDDMGFIEGCVERCYFHKGDGKGFHYHPLALEALGRQLGCLGRNPFEWVKNLLCVREFNMFSGENLVFDVLRSSFDVLPVIEQALFMDVGFFLYRHFFLGKLKEKLCVLFKENGYAIQSRLDLLKRKGLLQDADLTFGSISMHDLYHEFAELEAKGKLGEATDMLNRRWVHVDIDGELSKLENTPAGGCWQKLIRLSIFQGGEVESLKGIEWQYFSNVELLHLGGFENTRGVVNLKGMKCLRSLQLQGFTSLNRLEGLEGLMNLSCFVWKNYLAYDTMETRIVGQLPPSLKYLDLDGKFMLEPNALTRCNNLCTISLRFLEVGLLDLSNCLSLESVKLSYMEKLQTLLGLNTRSVSRLQHLEVWNCRDLVVIVGLDHLIDLEELSIEGCGLTKVPNLLSLTKLQDLRLIELTLVVPIGPCIPRQLRRFEYWFEDFQLSEAPNFNGFKQLQVLDLSKNKALTCVEGMGDLPKLQSLDLSECSNLLQLPQLSKSTNLEVLNLYECLSLELHEEDIQMLATLPLLQPVRFTGGDYWKELRLDPTRRKVLKCLNSDFVHLKPWQAWMENGWQERDLGLLPIKLQEYIWV